MAVLLMRFDCRNPPHARVSSVDRYANVLEMASWADARGFDEVVLSEHHGTSDEFMCSPLIVASAIAARTEKIKIRVASMIAATHNPIRLAEDIATVDLVSKGRVRIVLANGYVERELAMFGERLSGRVRRTVELVDFLRKAWTGEEFTWRGRPVRVTPQPFTPGGPAIVLGGASTAAARRAARIGDGFMPVSPEFWLPYRAERVRLGHRDPGPYLGADRQFIHLTNSPDTDWELIRPYVAHEAIEYSRHGTFPGDENETDPDALRASGRYSVTTPLELVERIRVGGRWQVLQFHPMMGGIPPELAWRSLRLFDTEILSQTGPLR